MYSILFQGRRLTLNYIIILDNYDVYHFSMLTLAQIEQSSVGVCH